MKKAIILFLALMPVFYFSRCLKKGQQKGKEEITKESPVPDTGYTGIKQYYSGNFLSYEVEFKNGVRNGLMKTYYYPSGKLYQTFWYRNGLREDTAAWYYEDGKVFRKTPFRRDTIHGVQVQYYKSGRVRAKLEFEKGLRKPYLEEFTSDGKKITDYPEVVIKTTDDYTKNGTYKIYLSLNKKDVKAAFYKGGYVNGLFDPKNVTKINDTDYTGFLQLKKSGSPGENYVEVIAEISTPLGNKLLVNKKIDLPYNDLR
ncbi:MAG: toxin-antitoxin system YwqK family antitoxin [Bacteroidales bacterium]